MPLIFHIDRMRIVQVLLQAELKNAVFKKRWVGEGHNFEKSNFKMAAFHT